MTTTAQLGDSGITIGETDSLGCRWKWSPDSPDPWSPSPQPREVTGDNATTHGSWDGTEFYGPRTFAIEGSVVAPSHQALHEAKSRLWGACGIRPFALRIIEPGFDRFAMFRRNGDPSWSETNPSGPSSARFSIPLWAGDPRVYSTEVRTASTGFPSSTGGLTLPFTVPLTIPATVNSGQMVLVNDGNDPEVPAFPVFRIDGPVVNPGVVHMGTGQVWRLKLTLVAGEWVSVDTGSHQVLAMGDPGGSRRNTWWGDWFGLAPGSNTLRFTGASAGPGALLTASWRSAWI